MTWPDVERIPTPRSTCPDCGADDSQLGERAVTTQLEVVVDGELALRVEARCPCGWSDSFSITRADLEDETDD